MSPITSRQNSHVKWVRSLARADVRREAGVSFAEGVRVVEELLTLPDRTVHLFWSAGLLERPGGAALIPRAQGLGVPCTELSDAVLAHMADTRTPQGVLAVFRLAPVALQAVLARSGDVLVLDGVQDPGNMGTLLRTAEAAGAAGLVLAGACADPAAPKVVRAAAGSVFRLPYALAPDAQELIHVLRQAGVTIAVAEAGGEPPWETVALPGPLAWVLGAEGAGVSDPFRQEAGRRVAIPMASPVESLNVAVCGAILLYARRFSKGR